MTVAHQFLERYGVRLSAPDLVCLRAIATAFSHLPYENVTKILKHSLGSISSLKLRSAEEVLQDHLKYNTGGTCFSLCNALLHILHHRSFPAFIAMGDMHYGSNIHCAIIANVGDQPYLLDPGYLLHDPIPLPGAGLEVVRQTPMNTVSLRQESDNIFSLYTWESGALKWRYRLRASPTNRGEFEKHWLHSFSLNSMEHVMLSRLTGEGRVYFRKDRLEIVSRGERQKQKLTDIDPTQLHRLFGVPSDLILQAQKAVTGRR